MSSRRRKKPRSKFDTRLDASWYQTPEFLRLRDEWYRKLDEDDFQDQELEMPGVYIECPLLRHTAWNDGQRVTRARENGSDEYYRVAAQYLHSGTLTPIEEHLWSQHVEGKEIPEMTNPESKKTGEKLTGHGIKKILARVRRRMIEELSSNGNEEE